MTLSFPEPGLRLIRQNHIDAFNSQMAEFRSELQESVWRLGEHYEELKSAARERLGALYNASDYPDSLDGLFYGDQIN